MKTNLWNVTLPWAWSGDADDEGTYSTAVGAADCEAAVRAAAEEMADSGSKHFGDDPEGDDFKEERQRYVDSRCEGWADAYLAVSQLEQDLAAVFADELFPNGVRREIDLEALGRLIGSHRDYVLKA